MAQESPGDNDRATFRILRRLARLNCQIDANAVERTTIHPVIKPLSSNVFRLGRAVELVLQALAVCVGLYGYHIALPHLNKWHDPCTF